MKESTFTKGSLSLVFLLSSLYSLKFIEDNYQETVGLILLALETIIVSIIFTRYISKKSKKNLLVYLAHNHLTPIKIYLLISLISIATTIIQHNNLHGAAKLYGYVITTILFYIIYPFLLGKHKLFNFFIKIFIFYSIFFALSTILISIFTIEQIGFLTTSLKINPNYLVFGGYSSGGLYVHPITFGGLAVFAISLLFMSKVIEPNLPIYKSRQYYFLMTILFLGVYFAVSRASYLSLLAFLSTQLFIPKFYFNKILNFIFLCIFAYMLTYIIEAGFYLLVDNISSLRSFLRVEQGGEDRLFVWRLAPDIIKDQSAWLFGTGIDTSPNFIEIYGGEMLYRLGFPIGAAFHNSFITFLVERGFIATISYISIILYPILVLIQDRHTDSTLKKLLISAMLSTILFMNFTDNNIGGIRLSSLYISILPGIMISLTYFNRLYKVKA